MKNILEFWEMFLLYKYFSSNHCKMQQVLEAYIHVSLRFQMHLQGLKL